MDIKNLRTLVVTLQGRPIGVVHRLPGDRQIFVFDPDYVSDPKRPTFSLSFKNRTGGLATATRTVTRRLPPFFSVLIGNADMHLKSWSILYRDTRIATLSPAYDFVSTIPYIPNDQLALTFGGSRSLHDITADQVRRFSQKAALPLRQILQTVRETVELTTVAWPRLT